uniref:SCP domain-containing protein n=1 Tax=Strongyloides papillosus TaxID=174720 RepID=A0A0N5CI87_STREA
MIRINALRLEHGIPLLTYDWELSDKAQRHSDKYANKREVHFYNNSSIGTLIYRHNFGDDINPLTMWTIDKILVNYTKPDSTPPYLTYTQLIWKSTTKIGCGISDSNSNQGILVLCLFYPKGNIPRQYGKNILKPVEDDSITKKNSMEEFSHP